VPYRDRAGIARRFPAAQGKPGENFFWDTPLLKNRV